MSTVHAGHSPSSGNVQGELVAPAKVHPSFEWVRSEKVDSLNLVIEEYRHKKTGAQYFHLAADNPENVFLVALRTIPTDSTGVAHILEHTALCGSERFPVRDPFFMMIRRSLNTFMNAFTSSDWTAYPFASQNRKDFNNLLDVYLDAVFFSSLHPLDFAQEGHRVEFEQADNPDSDLVYKGVVYNEMKGAMSSPVSTLWQTLTRHLFPSTTYHYNSGGDPENIPDLSYEELKEFYKTHYHPSNAVLMTYGDIPAFEHQQVFEEKALSRFEPLGRQIEVGEEQRYSDPVRIAETYAFDDTEDTSDKTHVVMGWLLGLNTSLEDVLKAHILSGVLLDNGSSPLRLALETTSLGSAPSPLCGVEDSNHEMSFICGVEGSNPGHEDEIEKLILDVLGNIAANGVEQERIEAVLHQLEFSQREVSGDGYPYGLHLILDCLPFAIHRGDPLHALNLDLVIDKLRDEIKDPDFIKDLVRVLLLENRHRVTLTLSPDTELSSRKEKEEELRLHEMKTKMSDPEKQDIVDLAHTLQQRQMQVDDPEVLPKVGLEDIPPEIKSVEGTVKSVSRWPVKVYEQGTNGIVYQQVIVDMPALEEELMEVLPYYTTCLTELGVGERDYLQTQAWQSNISGGIHAYTSVRSAIDDLQHVGGYFVFSGKALVRNHGPLTELMGETLDNVRFDEHSRIREIIAQQRAQREQGVTGNGHALAMMAASSGLSPVASLSHRLRGLQGVHSLKALDDGLNEQVNLSSLSDKLAEIHKRIKDAPRQFLLIGEHERCDDFLDGLNMAWKWDAHDVSRPFFPLALPETRCASKQMWIANTQVNFTAKAYPTVHPDHPDNAILSVLAGFLRNGYLHRAIREQGGAYGGGATHDADNGAFKFYSYRDPRLEATLDDFDKSIRWLLDEKHEWYQVEEAILGVIGSMDKPGSPAGEAKKNFHNDLFGRTREKQQLFRERVLQVGIEDLKRMGEAYLLADQASIAVITSSAAHEQYGDLGLKLHKL